MSLGPRETGTATGTPTIDPRRWHALAVLGLVQLMLILDTTVVNVALPSIREGLGFSTTGLAWVVNGYALASGGFLILGGRLGDAFGRRLVFQIGVGIFALASAACAASAEPWQLTAGRFGQGFGAALATPAALALVSLLFPDQPHRTRALSVWGGIAGAGGMLGVLLSGVLTDLANWRWVFLINLPIAAVALILVPRLVPGDAPASTPRDRLDLKGAVLVTVGITLVIDGLLRAGDTGWASTSVLVRIAAGVLLLALFIGVEARTASPLLPLSFLRHRTRVSAYVANMLSAAAMASLFYLLTLYLQEVLGWTPLLIGVAWVPFGIFLILGVSATGSSVRRLGLRGVIMVGFGISAIGMLLLAQLQETATYGPDVLPGMALLGFGLGLTAPAIQGAALTDTTTADAAIASGVHSSISQLGGSTGLAIFVSVVVARLGSADAGESLASATTAAYTLAFVVAAGILLAGTALGLLIQRDLGRVPKTR